MKDCAGCCLLFVVWMASLFVPFILLRMDLPILAAIVATGILILWVAQFSGVGTYSHSMVDSCLGFALLGINCTTICISFGTISAENGMHWFLQLLIGVCGVPYSIAVLYLADWLVRQIVRSTNKDDTNNNLE